MSRSSGRSVGRTGGISVVPDRQGRRVAPTPWWLAIIDALLVVGLGVLSLWPLGVAYGGHRWLVVALTGLLLGVAVGKLGAWLRWGPWLTALAAVVVYLLAASALAVPAHDRHGAVPTAKGLRSVAVGAVKVWRDSLTLPTPLGSSGVVMIVPLALGLLGALLAVVFLWRSPWPGAAGIVLVAMTATAAAFGDLTAQATLPRGLAVAGVGILWLRLRSMRHVHTRWLRRVVPAVLVVAVAGIVAGGLSALGSDATPRAVLREHVQPPFDPQDYPSPLSKFRFYKKEPVRSSDTLFTVDGLTFGSLVRLATMDSYDGIVWNVSGGPGSSDDSGTFKRLRDDPRAADKGDVHGRVTIGDYTGVWVPSVGNTLAMNPYRDGAPDGDAAAQLVINPQTGTVAQVGGVHAGETFQLDATVPPTYDDEEVKTFVADNSLSLPAPAIVPEELVDRVQQWATERGFEGDTGGALAEDLRDAFREKGYYSDGADDYTPAGHGAHRLAVLLKTETPVGDAEQYAAAMTLAAQHMGLPARVVIGFKVPPGGGAVHGSDITAWTEIRFKGKGWVPFEPTPPETKRLRKPNDIPKQDPQPQVLQPPRVPGDPKDASDNLQQGEGHKSHFDLMEVIGRIVAVAITVAKWSLVTSPLWGILLFKFVRRRRRRRASDAMRRLNGAWREFADRVRDLGIRTAPGMTRQETALAAGARYVDVPLVALAQTADRHLYGPVRPTAEDAKAYWAEVNGALKQIRRASPWWRRIVSRFSLASVPWRSGLERLRARARRAGAWVLRRRPVAWLIRASRRRIVRIRSRNRVSTVTR